jgi:hypothetical protein
MENQERIPEEGEWVKEETRYRKAAPAKANK